MVEPADIAATRADGSVGAAKEAFALFYGRADRARGTARGRGGAAAATR
jgi:hypothetical protein